MFLSIISIYLIGCGAAEKEVTDLPLVNPSGESYEAEYKRALTQADTTEFTNLRMSFTQTENHNPYDLTVRKELVELLTSGQFSKCIERADIRLKTEFVNIIAHFAALVCHTESGDADKAMLHKFMMNGLMRSIEDSGDEASTKTAYQLISTTELYNYLYLNRLNAISQQLIQENGRAYDRMTVVHSENGKKYTIYFDVTRQFIHGSKIF